MYLFRREDTGEVVEVSFEEAMRQDVAGWITLPDGAAAKRCVRLENRPPLAREKHEPPPSRPLVSDAMGFGEHQLAEFEADRRANGFTNVEFVRDPAVPQFFKVKCGSRREHARYVKHRGYVNRTGIGGLRLSTEDMERARQFVMRATRKERTDAT